MLGISGSKTISKAISTNPAVLVNKYSELLEKVARLSYKYKTQILYFRGQCQDFKDDKGKQTTLFPSIYRNTISKDELKFKFTMLDKCVRDLVKVCNEYKLDGLPEVKRRKHIAWSILQHYEICDTPFLDLTHSLRVACTFATLKKGEYGYIYVIGLPYLTNRVTINSEDELTIIRLLSISPPDAKRPYYQEGYLAGTPDVYDWYDAKDEFDFKSRLVGKFMFKNEPSFWDDEFNPINKEFLYPANDIFQKIQEEVSESKNRSFQTGDLGEFFNQWNDLQDTLAEWRKRQSNNGLINLDTNNVLREYNFDNEFTEIRDLRNTLRDSIINNSKINVSKEVLKSLQGSIEKLAFYNSIISQQK